jgi:hypothetical protein
MTFDHQDYHSWLQHQFGVSPTVFLDNLGDWLEAHCSDSLDSVVLQKLASCEATGDSDGFMQLLGPHRNRLGRTVAGILYHRWIRLLTLNHLPPSDRKTVEHIAIAYLPNHPLPEAFITATPRGHVICFSEIHSFGLLTLFQALVAAAPITSIASPGLQIQETDVLDRIIDLARIYTGASPQITLKPLGLNENLIFLSDLMHNNLQLFIMCHEYSHFLLGHLKTVPLPTSWPPQPVASQTQISSSDDPKERDADDYAARLLKRSNTSRDDINHNALIFSSLMVYFFFTILCRLVIGFKLDSLQAQLERGQRIGEVIFGDNAVIHQLKEVEIMIKALDRYLSTRH